jgi:hypothetical protein
MDKHNITQSEANGLYRMFKILNDTLLKHGISYWVTGGSLLGAIRHNGIVPWDDDGDICIMKKDVPKLRKLIAKFKKLGYVLEEGKEGEEGRSARCLTKKNSCTWFMEADKGSLGMDIFIMERVGAIITYADPYWRTASNGGKTCYFFNDYVFPLLPMRFGNFFVMAPNNPVEHLNGCYGTDWNAKAQRLFDHREGKWVESEKRRMMPSDYRTLKAPKDTCDPISPDVPCARKIGPRTEDYKNIATTELKFIAKVLKVKNYTKMTRTQLVKTISSNSFHSFH